MDPCIEWTGARNPKGYGCRRAQRASGTTLVHRQVWEEAYGPIPDGLIVMHRCDNPPCMNLAHLTLGTVADNQQDMAAKRRSVKDRVHRPLCPRCGAPKTRRPDGRMRCLPCHAADERARKEGSSHRRDLD